MGHRIRRIPARPLPPGVDGALLTRLAELHADAPFTPDDPRGAAQRVVAAAGELAVPAHVARGPVLVSGAELDHVFAVVVDRVVDVALPLAAPGFTDVLRAWIAGDVETVDVVAAASGHRLEQRVVGAYPADVEYRGAALWGRAA